MKRFFSIIFVLMLFASLGLSAYFYYDHRKLAVENASLQHRLDIATDALYKEVARLKEEKEGLKKQLSKNGKMLAQAPVAQKPASANSTAEPQVIYVEKEPSSEFERIQQTQLDQNVTRKYDLLLRLSTTNTGNSDELMALLRERERILNMTTDSYYSDDLDLTAVVQEQQQMLAELDDKINGIMDPESFDRYEVLKDSGFEQYQVRQFDNALGSDNFMSSDQSDNLLMAKLNRKQEYSRSLQAAQELISQGDVDRGVKAFESAVEEYKRTYFQEAENILTPEQFKKLKEYEGNEFQSMLNSLIAPHI